MLIVSTTFSATAPDERVVSRESYLTVILMIRSMMSGSTTSGVTAKTLKGVKDDFINAIWDVDNAVAPVGFADMKTLPNLGMSLSCPPQTETLSNPETSLSIIAL